jgi:DNA segregation ATPase FtsK/SpoIIIE-like protein
VGIHVIAATQRVSNLPRDIAAAFPTRVVGRTAFVEDSVELLSTDVATRIEGSGDALLWSPPDGEVLALRRAYLDPSAGLLEL